MIDNIASNLARVSLGLGVGGAASSMGPAGSVPVTDAQRFLTALNAPAAPSRAEVAPAAQPTVSSAWMPEGSRVAPPASGPVSMGEAILNTFRSTAHSTTAEWQSATQAVMQRELTTSEMLQVQVRLISVSFQLELISKGVSKMTTNLDQTLKTQ